MLPRITRRLCLTAVLFGLVFPTLRAEEVKFFGSPGTYPIPDSGEKIVITQEGPLIQYRIRGAGTAEPTIKADSGWFVAMIDKDHYVVHLGEKRFRSYAFPSEGETKVVAWVYPCRDIAVPNAVDFRMRQLEAR